MLILICTLYLNYLITTVSTNGSQMATGLLESMDYKGDGLLEKKNRQESEDERWARLDKRIERAEIKQDMSSFAL